MQSFHDGAVWAWGWGSSGQLGVGDTNERRVPSFHCVSKQIRERWHHQLDPKDAAGGRAAYQAQSRLENK